MCVSKILNRLAWEIVAVWTAFMHFFTYSMIAINLRAH